MLGFGVGISHCGIRGGVSDAPDFAASAAKALLAGESQGLAFDFTDSSAYIIDTGTPANNYDSTGIVSSGALVGPSGKLTYTSPSNKLTLQSDGFLRYQAHNLCVQSENFETTWVNVTSVDNHESGEAPPSGYSRVYSLYDNAAGGTGEAYITQSITGIGGATYNATFMVKAGSLDWCAVVTTNPTLTTYFDLSTGALGTTGHTGASITDAGNGWYKVVCPLTCAASGAISFRLYLASADLGFNTVPRDGTSYVLFTGAHFYRYPANADYIRTSASAVYALPLEYSATDGSCLGLLVEEHRTNLVPQSNNIGGGGSGVNATADALSADNIFGVSNGATTLSFTNGGSASYYESSNSLSAVDGSSTYCISAIVEYVDEQFIQFTAASSAFGTLVFENFDLVNGTSGSAGRGASGAAGIKQLATNVFRIWVSGASTVNAVSAVAIASAESLAAARLATATGSATTCIVHHYQLEKGSFPTSPIITYGAADTRAVDDISISLSATPIPDFTSSAHTIGMFAEYISRATVGSAIILSISDSSSSDYASIYENGSRLPAFVYVTSNAGGQGANLFDAAGQTEGATVSIAARLKEDDVAVSYTGRSQDTDSTVDLAGTAFNLIGIGRHYSAAQPSQIIRKIVLVPSEWSNATLEAKVGN